MIHGKNIIGFGTSAQGNQILNAHSANGNTALNGDFVGATTEELNQAVAKAQSAFQVYKNTSGADKAAFLDAIAEEIENLGDTLVERAVAESGLPSGRITGERGRTTGQLRAFATLLREGSWVEARIETAIPDRQPLPKADIRKMLFPIGPVAVFTASNFPLAFSTAGGDTAAALAAGCPVIVKAHESHLGTNELVAGAIIKAAQRTNMPDGVFSSINSVGYTIAQELVKHPSITAVAFTGSERGGKALFDIASQRPQPIPVFAEMGSVNPVVFMPNKLAQDTDGLAATYAGSITLGVGQFCTNPGILLAVESEALNDFSKALAEKIAALPANTMLNQGIRNNFVSKREAALAQKGIEILTHQNDDGEMIGGALAKISGANFLQNPSLKEEVFGPFSILIACSDIQEVATVLGQLTGQLTVSLMVTDEDVNGNIDFIQNCRDIAGRVIFNGAPTGVEVCHAMHHGGAFPASTDAKFTSVGQDAIKRFVRPISLQNCPAVLLPAALQNDNPLGIMRLVNGEHTNGQI